MAAAWRPGICISWRAPAGACWNPPAASCAACALPVAPAPFRAASRPPPVPQQVSRMSLQTCFLVLDDMNWSVKSSVHYRRNPKLTARYSPDEAATPTVRRTWDTILPHPGYDRLRGGQGDRLGDRPPRPAEAPGLLRWRQRRGRWSSSRSGDSGRWCRSSSPPSGPRPLAPGGDPAREQRGPGGPAAAGPAGKCPHPGLPHPRLLCCAQRRGGGALRAGAGRSSSSPTPTAARTPAGSRLSPRPRRRTPGALLGGPVRMAPPAERNAVGVLRYGARHPPGALRRPGLKRQSQPRGAGAGLRRPRRLRRRPALRGRRRLLPAGGPGRAPAAAGRGGGGGASERGPTGRSSPPRPGG